MPERDPTERARSFAEVNLGYGYASALREAERCIQCIKPTCIDGCPVSIDIPRFIRHLLVRDVDAAAAAIHESSIFPSVCGRVCPQESQCEAQCVLDQGEDGAGGDRPAGALRRRPRACSPPGSRRASTRALGQVAIVGSGPGGLAAAADLVKLGAEVTVYEALHVVGGVLRYGIPSFRLPRDIIDREVQRLKDSGVRFETNKVIGKTFTLPQLTGKMGFDAVFVAAGAGAPAFLGIPGEFAGQVYSANEFLTRVNLMGGDQFPYRDTPIGLGQDVVVIGAGNTAMDCLRVAQPARRRSGCAASTGAPRPRRRRAWKSCATPRKKAWSSASCTRRRRSCSTTRATCARSGCRRWRWARPTRAAGARRCRWASSSSGPATPSSTRSAPRPTRSSARPRRSWRLNRRGYIVADAQTQATNLPGVFAGGDIVTGGATVILAMSAGRRAARAIATWLQMQPRRWPVTQQDVEAFEPPVPRSAATTH